MAPLLPCAGVWCYDLLPSAQDCLLEVFQLSWPCSPLQTLRLPLTTGLALGTLLTARGHCVHCPASRGIWLSSPIRGQASMGHYMGAGSMSLSLRYSSPLCPKFSPSRNSTCLCILNQPFLYLNRAKLSKTKAVKLSLGAREPQISRSTGMWPGVVGVMRGEDNRGKKLFFLS